MIELVSFHGGCDICTQQTIHNGYEFCMKCQNFDADWDLPDLNNRPPTKAEMIKTELRLRRDCS